MIKTGDMTINGKPFVHTYSDSGFKLERDGDLYSDAMDPAEFGRTYTETDEPINGYTDEATAEDYEAALAEMGVEV